MQHHLVGGDGRLLIAVAALGLAEGAEILNFFRLLKGA